MRLAGYRQSHLELYGASVNIIENGDSRRSRLPILCEVPCQYPRDDWYSWVLETPCLQPFQQMRQWRIRWYHPLSAR